jgi:parallel beta-helix repeat protein
LLHCRTRQTNMPNTCKSPTGAFSSIGRSLLALAATAVLAGAVLVEVFAVSPRLLGAYVEQRASGHALGIGAMGALDARPGYPRWARGSPAFDSERRDTAAASREVIVLTEKDALQALSAAEPGDVIVFVPGRYRFSGRALTVNRAGRADAPIIVTTRPAGSAVLEFDMVEGFHVSAPYWIFEDLDIRGVCARHDDCEHAFHVVGAAHRVVIRNNEVRDFNAHVKINGDRAAFPDGGRLEGNVFINSEARNTSNPVTPVDLVAASDWVVRANLIADFVKGGGDRTSYGGFAKGGGSANRFTGNVVLCEHRLRGAPGRRVGLSFGGGGSQAAACRDRRCLVEHQRGVMDNNVIASCSDVGIYVNRSAQTRIVHNTLIDTAGVLVRHPESSATGAGNLIDGGIAVRDGARFDDRGNRTAWFAWAFAGIHPVRRLFADPEVLDLRWRDEPPRLQNSVGPDADLCGRDRPRNAAYGAFEDIDACSGRGAAAEIR